MNYNTDGFNERTNYIITENEKKRLSKMGTSNIDSSFAKMKTNENKPDIKTINSEKKILKEEVRGNKENFVLRNKNMMSASSALRFNKNPFKKI